MAIGDAGNDYAMIKYAGVGVAMANAYPEIKEIANYVTSSNEESGVAKAINLFVNDPLALLNNCIKGLSTNLSSQ